MQASTRRSPTVLTLSQASVVYVRAGLHVSASCVLYVYVPEAQGSLPLRATTTVRTPYAHQPCVLYVPRTVAPQVRLGG